VPVAVVLALAAATTSSPSHSGQTLATAVVPVSPVPDEPATVEPCAQIQANLPVVLNGKAPRIVHAVQAYAWGEPPVVVRCGVARPAALVANSSADIATVNTVNFLVQDGKKAIVYTVVDRSLYLEVTLPAGTDPATDVPVIANAVAKALPNPVCYVDDPIPSAPNLPMCTRR